jgi:2-polyprenyl-3-methyl-5-hydroxy-6-metoxy-1,4-benzoquinol methylase
MTACAAGVEERARQSQGRGHERIHAVVASLLAARQAGGTLADVGCGTGDLWRATRHQFARCVGFDAIRYPDLPEDVAFERADLDRERLPLPDGGADAAAAVEVIEHLENPRALFRELARITRPGGWVVVTTPNQLSGLSLLTLLIKGQYSAFQSTDYPAHRTALLEVDLRRIATESGLSEIEVAYTQWGRVPLSPWHYPAAIAALAPRRLSDNVALIGRKCA